jgi:hypothetical protein
MPDGSRSCDHEVPEKKKSAKSQKKSKGKRTSALNKSMKSDKDKSAQKKKGAAKGGKSKKSDDDLDIESEEGSGVQESD